jgi:hypothetical protein
MKIAQPSGRVPHVRPSVRGTKTMGRSPFERFSLVARDTVPEIAARTEVKAFEDIVFGPCTLKRTPGFLLRGSGTQPRVRLSSRKAA